MIRLGFWGAFVVAPIRIAFLPVSKYRLLTVRPLGPDLIGAVKVRERRSCNDLLSESVVSRGVS